MTAPPRPKVVPLPDEPPPSRPATPRGSSRRILGILAAAAALALSWGVWAQTRRVQALESELAGVRGELAATRHALAAWEAHRGRVQDAVADLLEQLGALEGLVAADPLTAPEVGAEAP